MFVGVDTAVVSVITGGVCVVTHPANKNTVDHITIVHTNTFEIFIIVMFKV